MECVQGMPVEGGSVLLVVDDYPENLMSMRALLQRPDWEIITAQSGVEALDSLLRHDVDLVLLDVHMPGMNGFEVARLMRGSQRTRFTPIIFLTANAQSKESVLEGYACGAVDYLLKPFDPQILKPKVQALLEQQSNARALRRLSHDLEVAQAFNASVLENAAEGILVVNEDGLIRYANPAISRLLKTPVLALTGAPFLNFLQKPHVPDWYTSAIYRSYRQGETYRAHDSILLTALGHSLPVTLSCAPLSSPLQAMVVTVLDMSEVRHLHHQLELQAVTDPLTGLLNRRGFHRAAETALMCDDATSCVQALLYLDLDGFKRINDSVGHEAGDWALSWVSEQLQLCIRPGDILGRIGGDEFTVLLKLSQVDEASTIAQQIIDKVGVHQKIEGLDVNLGVSIGIAVHPESGANLENLLRAADDAMYEAKRAGRQQYRYFSQMMNDPSFSVPLLRVGEDT